MGVVSSERPCNSLANSFEMGLVILHILLGTSLRTPLMIWSLSGWMILLPLRSTRNPLECRKSAPRIDCWRVPNDFIREPFAAMRFVLVGRDRSLDVGGMMLTSAPVSTRNWAPDMESLMWSRVDLGWLKSAVRRLFIAVSPDRVGSFPTSG